METVGGEWIPHFNTADDLSGHAWFQVVQEQFEWVLGFDADLSLQLGDSWDPHGDTEWHTNGGWDFVVEGVEDGGFGNVEVFSLGEHLFQLTEGWQLFQGFLAHWKHEEFLVFYFPEHVSFWCLFAHFTGNGFQLFPDLFHFFQWSSGGLGTWAVFQQTFQGDV